MVCEVLHCKKEEVDRKVEEILTKLNWKPKQDSTVLIKPNLCSVYGKKKGEFTNVYTTKAVIKYLQKFGCTVLVGETNKLGPTDKGFTFDDLIKNSDYTQLKNLPNVKIVDLEQGEFKTVKVKKMIIKVPKLLDEVDHYINIATLKTHWQTKVTLSLKNQMGIVPEEMRKIFHRIDLEEAIACLGKAAQPELIIIDGVVGMEGESPHWGTDKIANLLIAGTNMVEVDSLSSYLIGTDPENVRHLVLARQLKVGKFSEKIGSPEVQPFITPFKKPDQTHVTYGKFSVWQDGCHGCSGCGRATELIKFRVIKNPALLSKFLNRLLFKKTDIILGVVNLEKTKLETAKMGEIFCIGNCSKPFSEKYGCKFLPGCPPTAKETMEFILNGKTKKENGIK